jgi:hypothetical protein
MTPRHATKAPKFRFAATLDEDPEVEVALAWRLRVRVPPATA